MWTELVCVLLRLFLLAAVPPAGGRGRSVQVLKVLGLRDSSRAGRYHPISHPGRGSGWLSDQPPGAGAAPHPHQGFGASGGFLSFVQSFFLFRIFTC